MIPRQLGLFSAPSVALDASFAELRRTELAHGAWIDHAPGWLRGHDVLFDQLSAAAAWRHETLYIYDKEQVVPRLIAGSPGHPVLDEAARLLHLRYREVFPRITLALYRDGRDSVAFHGDTTARDMDVATVATISLGAPRRLLLKPTQGGRSLAYNLGGGDLFVMGGTCQRTWRHGIPKVASAGPRIAVMFRPVWESP